MTLDSIFAPRNVPPIATRSRGWVGQRSGFCGAVPGGCVQELLERSLPD